MGFCASIEQGSREKAGPTIGIYLSLMAGTVPSVIIPEPGNGPLGDDRASEALAVVVEQGELVAIEHVAVRLALDSRPQLVDGIFEDLFDVRWNVFIVAISGFFQGLPEANLIS